MIPATVSPKDEEAVGSEERGMAVGGREEGAVGEPVHLGEGDGEAPHAGADQVEDDASDDE